MQCELNHSRQGPIHSVFSPSERPRLVPYYRPCYRLIANRHSDAHICAIIFPPKLLIHGHYPSHEALHHMVHFPPRSPLHNLPRCPRPRLRQQPHPLQPQALLQTMASPATKITVLCLQILGAEAVAAQVRHGGQEESEVCHVEQGKMGVESGLAGVSEMRHL